MLMQMPRRTLIPLTQNPMKIRVGVSSDDGI